MSIKTVTFKINIPIFDTNNYELIHIVPLPINKTKILILPKYVIHNQAGIIKEISSKCPKVHQSYICEDNITPAINQQCLKGILNEETTTCDIKDIGSEEIIKEIEQLHIIVFNTINTTITSTCGRPKRINGSAIITFKNCSININRLKYDDIEIDYTEEYILSIPELEDIKINNTINDISLHKLHLQTLNTQNGIIEMKNLNVTHLTAIYVLMALFAITIGIVCTCKTNKILFTPMETPSDGLPTIPSLWPSLHTRGGGVTISAPSIPPEMAPTKPHRFSTAHCSNSCGHDC